MNTGITCKIFKPRFTVTPKCHMDDIFQKKYNKREAKLHNEQTFFFFLLILHILPQRHRDKNSPRFTGKEHFPFRHPKSRSADRLWARRPTVQGTEEQNNSELHFYSLVCLRQELLVRAVTPTASACKYQPKPRDATAWTSPCLTAAEGKTRNAHVKAISTTLQ